MHPRIQSIADLEVGLAPLNLPRQHALPDDADGEFLEATLLRMLDQDEEYFNVEDFLLELAPPTQVQATGSAPQGSHQGRFQPPSSGSLGGGSSSNCNNKNPLVKKILVSVYLTVEELPGIGRIAKLTKKYFCFM